MSESETKAPGRWSRSVAYVRGVPARLRVFGGRVGSAWGRLRTTVRTAAIAAAALAARLWAWVRAFAESLQTTPRSRFLTLVWVFFFLFIGISLLSAANPLRLLVPGLVFPIPTRDTRPVVKVYAVAAADRKLVGIRRRMLATDRPELKARRILQALTRPPAVQVQENDDVQDLIPIPEVVIALRGVWMHSKDRMVLDFRQSTLAEELKRTVENRRPVRSEAEYMEAFVRAYTRSLFEHVPGLRSVQFVIDGQASEWKGIGLNLREPITLDRLEPKPKAVTTGS